MIRKFYDKENGPRKEGRVSSLFTNLTKDDLVHRVESRM